MRAITGWLRRTRPLVSGVRGRTALAAAAVVALVLVGGVLAMLALLRGQLLGALDDSLSQAATARAELVNQGAQPGSLVDIAGDESMIWIGTGDGEALAVGGRYQPVAAPVVEHSGQPVTVIVEVVEQEPNGPGEREDNEMRVVRADTDTGVVVMVGTELEVVDETVERFGRLFLVATPVMVALVFILTWAAVGRALQPVERIRAETEEIGGRDLSRRVPLPQSSDEIRLLAETMNDMLGRLEAHQRGRQRFTADASHELKSPVANIRVLLDTHRVTDPAWLTLRSNLDREVDRLRSLIDNLLFLAAHDENRDQAVGSVEPTERVAVDDLLFAEAEILAATTRHRVDLSGVGPAIVTGHAGDLTRLVRNLVDNAARHATTTVRLACRQLDSGQRSVAGGEVVLEVADDGPGVDPGDRERIFDRFSRLDDGRDRDQGGTGLGLAIVRAVAEHHGADIEVRFSDESERTGSRFIVVFPDRADVRDGDGTGAAFAH